MAATEHDVNFCFPVPKYLESERVRLTPFIPSKHAKVFVAASTPSMYDHLPFGPFDSATSLTSTLIEGRIQPNPACVLFAVHDKTQLSEQFAKDGGALAGTIGLLNTSSTNLQTEIGFVLVLPAFQRTHVTSNAIGLLLRWALDAPMHGGLGLRRVAWRASPLNVPSVNAAKRLGFRQEGVLRWDRVLPDHKVNGNGIALRGSDPRKSSLGRDTVVLGLCWDDWEKGGREHVEKVISRTV